jgi:hypothetical protein
MTHALILLPSMVGGAIAISVGILSARRASTKPSQSPASLFVMATLFAAMTGAMIYQGVSNGFPPSFLGAAVFFAGVVIALGLGLRRPQA